MAELGSPSGSDLAPATIHRVVPLLSQCVNAAVEDRLIQYNPVAKLPLPKVERREMRFLTAEELWRLADAIEPRYRSFVLLGGFGGLRLGEMLGLRWGRVDLLRRRVRVAETLVDIEGHIYFGPAEDEGCGALGTDPDVRLRGAVSAGRPRLGARDLDLPVTEWPSAPSNPVRRRVMGSGRGVRGLAPLRIHDLRHTAVSLWIAEGAHPKHVAVLAGHTSVSVVLDGYGHLPATRQGSVRLAYQA